MRILSLFLWLLATLPCIWATQNALSSQPPLRCCLMQEKPISFKNEQVFANNGIDGVIADHVLQMKSYLNWSCSTTVLFKETGSSDFNAFVDNLYKCTNKSTGQIIDSPECFCDIGLGGWFQTPGRFPKVDFLPPIVFDSYIVFAHISSATVSGKMWFFLLTFDAMAWVCIVALVFMFAFLKTLDSRFSVAPLYSPLPNTCSKFQRYSHFFMKSPLLYRCRKAFQSALTRMLLLSDDRVVENGNATRQWLLNLFISVCALFLILSYEASMTASLVQESFSSQYQSVSDFQSCRVKPSDICIIKGGALETFWNNSIAINACHENEKPQFKNSYPELFQAVQDSRCIYGITMESILNNAIRETYCGTFVSLGEALSTGGLSMLLPKHSNLTEPMSLGVLDLLQNQTKTYLNKYFNTLPHCRADVNTNLSFNKLRLFFFLAFGFGLVIFLEMLFGPQQLSSKQDSKVSCLKENQVTQTKNDSIDRNRSPSLSTASQDTN